MVPTTTTCEFYSRWGLVYGFITFLFIIFRIVLHNAYRNFVLISCFRNDSSYEKLTVNLFLFGKKTHIAILY
jgi:hypothetical protein